MTTNTGTEPIESYPKLEWLRRYSSTESIFQWQRIEYEDGRILYHRPLGLVERMFHLDGEEYDGRADVNGITTLEIRTSLSQLELRARVEKCWSNLRLYHPMLRAKALRTFEFLSQDLNVLPQIPGIHFVVEKPRDQAALQQESMDTIEFLSDYYDSIDPHEFYTHSQNTGRIVDPAKSLSKMFILPFEPNPYQDDRYTMRFLLVTGHEIMDGMTLANWTSHFVKLLNLPIQELDIEKFFEPRMVKDNFPLAQETLYPQISGSRARKRWFWVLTLIRRHILPPLPAGFSNPLCRESTLPSRTALPLVREFSAVLNYDVRPPCSTLGTMVMIPTKPTRRLHRLCRDAGISIGAGSFALTALVAMELEEERFPNVPLEERKPCVISFPLDPRAMFDSRTMPESLMLAFSWGIIFPFLPSYVPVEGRLKLLAKQAQKQLQRYQKRPPKNRAEEIWKNNTRLLAENYILCIERSDITRPEELVGGESNPQGDFPAASNMGKASHGVSSIGSATGVLRAGAFPVEASYDGHDLIADFRGIRQGVRVRPNEFLIGMGGNNDNLWAVTNADSNTLDPSRLERWKYKMETILDTGDDHKL